MKKIITVLFAFIISYSTYSANNNYQCYIKNQKQISKNQMTFEIWVYWENSDSIQFQSIQAGIDFDYSAIANGGKLSASIIPNSSQQGMLNIRRDNIGIKVDEISKQLRIAAYITPKSPNFLRTLNEFKIGTFKITNSVAFTSESKPNLTWSPSSSSSSNTGNIVFGVNYQTNKSTNITNLTNHKVENTDFKLNPNKNDTFIVYQDQEIIHFYIDNLNTGTTTISLFDMTGRLVQTVSLVTEDFQTLIDVNKENISSGVYLVKVTNNGNVFTNKLQIK